MESCFPEASNPPPAGLNLTTCIISGVIALLATLGNFLIIIIVVKDPLKKLHTPFNYFLVNLAVSDLIVGIVTMPLSFYVHYAESVIGTYSEFWSEVLTMSYFISAHASLLSLLALSVDRYIAIVKAIKYRLYLSWSRCIKVSCGIWLASTTLPFAYFKIGYTTYLMYYGSTVVLFGFVIIIAIFVKIIKFFHDHEQEMTMHYSSSLSRADSLRQSEKKVTNTFFVIIMVFIATYISAAIMNYFVHFCQSCPCGVLHILKDVQFLFVTVNCCINPYICTIRLKQYRLSVINLYERLRHYCRYGNEDVTINMNSELAEPLMLKETSSDSSVSSDED